LCVLAINDNWSNISFRSEELRVVPDCYYARLEVIEDVVVLLTMIDACEFLVQLLPNGY